MKSNIIINILVTCCLLHVTAQDNRQSTMDALLRQIEANSITLQALKQQTEAQKLTNRTGIYLANPELEFGYLLGEPESTGNRTDFSVTQSFDFPTAYAHKSKVADGRNRIADYEYERQRKELLLQAGTICINLIYCNALKVELDKRLQHAETIAAAYQERFVRGDAGILERNKAQLNLLNARKAAEANDIERTALLAELQQLNSGQTVVFDDTLYPVYAIPQDFEQWYEQIQQRNPALQAAAQEIEVSRQTVKLNRAMSLPRFSAGYMSESNLGIVFWGPVIGISIPLWENKNSIKQAKVQATAWQHIEADTRMQFYHSLKTQHAKALSLQAMSGDYRRVLQRSASADLLEKALKLGELSLINYIMELTVYYDAVDDMLQVERDGWLAIQELRQWEE